MRQDRLVYKNLPTFRGLIIQSTDKQTKSSLLTYEHRAILQNNFPKTPPQFIPAVYHHNSRGNLAFKPVLNHYSSLQFTNLTDQSDLFYYTESQPKVRLAQLQIHERPQVPEQRSRLNMPYRQMHTTKLGSGIQSWEGRTVARELATFHSFCILSIRKHYQCPT